MSTDHIINFPFCNFHSLERYLRVRGRQYAILDTERPPSQADILFLPGVGTFGQAIYYLNHQGLTHIVREHAAAGGRIIGICLGMQLLFESSDESPGVKGLGLIPGRCELIPSTLDFRVPHIGWNHLKIPGDRTTAFSKFADAERYSISDYYFVHSYVARPKEVSVITAYFEHPTRPLCAAVSSGSVQGVQFHPEKSGADGYLLLDQMLGSMW